MRKTFFVAAVVIAAVAVGSARAATVSVMTRNLYFGTNLSPVLAATTPSAFFAAVADAYDKAEASNFAGRMGRIADEIALTKPDLVGLQEAVQWRTQSPADFLPTPDATTDAGDFVRLLLDALAARGVGYSVASESTGYDVEGPGLFPTGFMDVRLTQHEVILARAGRGLGLANAQAGRYRAQIPPLTTAVGVPVALPWSWASVDVTKGGRTFRFATTHLDPNSGLVQRLQAQEFLQPGGPGDTPLPLVWVGDFNSAADSSGATGVPPDTATHSDVTGAGFTDAWAATRPDDPGFTCCNAENLLNPEPTYDHRIDYVFSRGDVRPLGALRVGVLPLERLPSGQWPSDHAGVYAVLDVG
jgi:endonuclease/exonuclease/phosphatase family metal-dependent hydrolase